MLLDDPGHDATGRPRRAYACRKVLARIKSGEELLRLQAARTRNGRSSWLSEYLVDKYGKCTLKEFAASRKRAIRDMQEFLKSTKLSGDAFGARRKGPQGRRTGVRDQYRFRRGGGGRPVAQPLLGEELFPMVCGRDPHCQGSHKFSCY